MEQRRPSSTSSDVSRYIHDCKPGHAITMENVRILDREPSWLEGGVKEAFLHPCTKTGAKQVRGPLPTIAHLGPYVNIAHPDN
ncbi:hypothetical protein DPMN_020843 [Dreissena polymorpha]|uniref:Uncharacterized protein n=1 Tax=Dreissena polymorpha TaxID=45954 RepID=A0A9D4NLR1_DREPO|nr:hypothetical protein DPMN_020843 [Dreissena polymorpha]